MITVCFHGGLRKFGRRFDLHAESPAAAMRLLLAQIDGLHEYLSGGSFQVRAAGRNCSEADIAERFQTASSQTVHIVPRVAGAGRNGGLQIVIGVILIAASWYAGGAAGWGYLGASGYGMATMAFMMGASMIIGGVSQMLTKTPSFEPSAGNDSNQSTSFSSIGNTAAQGRPVPLAYGKPYVGTRIISQGIETYRVDVDAAKAEAENPTMGAISTRVEKTWVSKPEAALAPNGKPYNTDFKDDSVKARNYTAKLIEG